MVIATPNSVVNKKGIISEYVNNTIGEYRGSPSNAQLFIIYTDNATQENNDSLNNSARPKHAYNIRSENLEYKWANGQLLEYKPANCLYLYKTRPYRQYLHSPAAALFSDDRCIGVSKIDSICQKLIAYDAIGEKKSLIAQRKKPDNLLKQKV